MELMDFNITNIVVVSGIVITLLLVLIHLITKSRQCLNFISPAWISLGILGTFVSIYSSLQDVDGEMENVVDSLIDSISPAFITSIIGISVALLCQVAIKIYYSFIEKKESKQFGSSPEQCLYEIKDSLLSFGSFVNNWNTESNDFINRLDGFYNDLKLEEEQRTRVITEQYTNALSTMIKHSEVFANSILKDSFSEHIGKINAILDEELKKMTVVFEQYKSELLDTAQETTSLIHSIQNTLIQQNEESLTQILGKVNAFEEKVLMDKSDKVACQLDNFENQIKLLTTQWQSLMQDGTTAFGDALQKMGAYNSTTLVALNNTCNVLKEICGQMTVQNVRHNADV